MALRLYLSVDLPLSRTWLGAGARFSMLGSTNVRIGSSTATMPQNTRPAGVRSKAAAGSYPVSGQIM